MSGKFTTDIGNDEYLNRLVFLIYSKPKVGKTTLLTKLLLEHEKTAVFLISADKGTKKIQLEAEKYKGRLAISYPDKLKDFRESIAQLTVSVPKTVEKRGAENVWIFLDTLTAMQAKLMTEARTMDTRENKDKKFKKDEPAKAEADEIYIRDLVTRADFNINLTHMVEITNAILRFPCNIVFTALEKQGEDVNKNPYYMPAISGQSKEKIVGDAEVIARLVRGSGENRSLICHSGEGWDAGDRTGRLDHTEPADLLAIRKKIFTQPQQQPNQ